MILLENLPNPQKRALDLVKEVAVEKALRPFLVGGPVRDLMLGRASATQIRICRSKPGESKSCIEPQLMPRLRAE